MLQNWYAPPPFKVDFFWISPPPWGNGPRHKPCLEAHENPFGFLFFLMAAHPFGDIRAPKWLRGELKACTKGLQTGEGGLGGCVRPPLENLAYLLHGGGPMWVLGLAA